eukprot:11169606-Lingulodinium_polyedra.AAC.1
MACPFATTSFIDFDECSSLASGRTWPFFRRMAMLTGRMGGWRVLVAPVAKRTVFLMPCMLE